MRVVSCEVKGVDKGVFYGRPYPRAGRQTSDGGPVNPIDPAVIIGTVARKLCPVSANTSDSMGGYAIASQHAWATNRLTESASRLIFDSRKPHLCQSFRRLHSLVADVLPQALTRGIQVGVCVGRTHFLLIVHTDAALLRIERRRRNSLVLAI